MPDTDPKTVINPDLDIVRYGAATSNGTAFFHVHVAGTLLGGEIPERLFKTPVTAGNGSSGGTTILARRTGEDVLLAFLDTNISNPQGFAIGGISANYLVEVRGEGGQITTKSVYIWSNRWIRQTGISVAAEKDQTDIEGSVPLASLNGTRVVIESTDWASTPDTTIPVAAPAFASPGQFGITSSNFPGPRPNDFAGFTLYLHAASSIGSTGCPNARSLDSSPGSGIGTNVVITSGSFACFSTVGDTSSESVPAGDWTASLDFTTPGTPTVTVAFAVTNNDGSSVTPVCSASSTTAGGNNQLFTCASNVPVPIGVGDRIRLKVDVSGSDITLLFDGDPPSADSSLTVPIPEFGELAFPASASLVVIVLVVSRRRRRSDRD